MNNMRPLTPGRTRGRDQQRAADVFAALRPPTKPGEHSVWCDVTLIEQGCFPLLARGVVVVLTEEKVFLRVAATAFTFTVHLQDVVLVRYVVPKDVVELHVRLPTSEPLTHRHVSQPSRSAFTHRLYRLALTERHTDLSARLFRALVDLLPQPAQQRTAEGTFTDDAVADYLVRNPCSMLPEDLLDRAGLREVAWVEDKPATPVNAAAAAASTAPPRVVDAAPPVNLSPFVETISRAATAHTYNEVEQNNALDSTPSSHSANVTYTVDGPSTTGHLRTIYVAPAPAFWRLPKRAPSTPESASLFQRQLDRHLTWSAARGQTSLPQPEVRPRHRESCPSDLCLPPQPSPLPPAPAVPSRSPLPRQSAGSSHRASSRQIPPTHSSRQEVVDMSSRESSLMADMCGLRPLAAPGSAPSSRASHSSDRTLKVQYGPVTSG